MKRRIVLGLGTGPLVGGRGATKWSDRHVWEFGLAGGLSAEQEFGYRARTQTMYGAGVISMAIGAGLMGSAVLRPTTHNAE